LILGLHGREQKFFSFKNKKSGLKEKKGKSQKKVSSQCAGTQGVQKVKKSLVITEFSEKKGGWDRAIN